MSDKTHLQPRLTLDRLDPETLHELLLKQSRPKLVSESVTQPELASTIKTEPNYGDPDWDGKDDGDDSSSEDHSNSSPPSLTPSLASNSDPPKPFICKVCKGAFLYKTHLLKHRRKFHPQAPNPDKKFKCSYQNWEVVS